MTAPFLLGIDGGATRSRARLFAADGSVLAEAEGGPANIRTDAAGGAAAILDLAGTVAKHAGLDPEALASVTAGLGLAGAVVPKDRARFVKILRSPFAAAYLATDAEAACFGAHGGGDGGVVIVGTGSCAVLIEAGRTRQLGGWGFPVSDAGSGAVIGLFAVRHALDAADGLAPAGPLGAGILAALGGSQQAVVAWAEGAGPRDYAALAPLVFSAEAEGDAAAARILAEAARALGAFVDRLADLGAQRTSVLGGDLARALAPRLPGETRARLSPPLGDALDGAAWIARAGWGMAIPTAGTPGS